MWRRLKNSWVGCLPWQEIHKEQLPHPTPVYPQTLKRPFWNSRLVESPSLSVQVESFIRETIPWPLQRQLLLQKRLTVKAYSNFSCLICALNCFKHLCLFVMFDLGCIFSFGFEVYLKSCFTSLSLEFESFFLFLLLGSGRRADNQERTSF